MKRAKFDKWLLCLAVLTPGKMHPQGRPPESPAAELRLRIVSSLSGNASAVPAVIWLEPMPGTPNIPFLSDRHYILTQKNHTFTPHLQVVPVGTVVQFPNADPFFHNVFSLFDGKRFDLGLYEAGSTKSVTFSRQGVSYIFCNIHPEMSAVVLALVTPLYAVADENNSFLLRNIPQGDYKLHIWIEGVPQDFLELQNRRVHFPPRTIDLGQLTAPISRAVVIPHTNKFGDTYTPDPQSTY